MIQSSFSSLLVPTLYLSSLGYEVHRICQLPPLCQSAARTLKDILVDKDKDKDKDKEKEKEKDQSICLEARQSRSTNNISG